LFSDLRTLASDFCFQSWKELMAFML